MNRFLVGVLVWTAAVLVGAVEADAQASRLGYINSQRIMAEAPGTAEAQAAFEQDMQRYQSELQRFETELETLQGNFERQQATLTAVVRQERMAEMQQKLMEYQQRREELEEEAQRRQGELVQPIMQKVTVVIEQIRGEGNYSIIFDAATGSMIAADPALDLTDQVLQRLRSMP